jgi:type II secretory pathway pseudopilin PulG
MELDESRSQRSRPASEAGFSLMETIVATLLLAVSLVSVAQLLAISTRANVTAKTTTIATVIAQQKMEQLRGLAWGFDALGLPVSDVSTDTTANPPASAGGTGLSPTPDNVLTDNVNGNVDFLDMNGETLGGGTDPPDNTLYVRRWSVEPLPTNPNNTLVLQVYVFRVDGRGNDLESGQPFSRFPEEARLVTVKTRKAQ